MDNCIEFFLNLHCCWHGWACCAEADNSQDAFAKDEDGEDSDPKQTHWEESIVAVWQLHHLSRSWLAASTDRKKWRMAWPPSCCQRYHLWLACLRQGSNGNGSGTSQVMSREEPSTMCQTLQSMHCIDATYKLFPTGSLGVDVNSFQLLITSLYYLHLSATARTAISSECQWGLCQTDHLSCQDQHTPLRCHHAPRIWVGASIGGEGALRILDVWGAFDITNTYIDGLLMQTSPFENVAERNANLQGEAEKRSNTWCAFLHDGFLMKPQQCPPHK